LQNHTLRHWPQRSSLPPLLPHASQEVAVGASGGESTPGAVVLGPAASGRRAATSVSAAVCVWGRQLAPEWLCLAAMTWRQVAEPHAPALAAAQQPAACLGASGAGLGGRHRR